MDARRNVNPVDELRNQIDAVAVLIEKIIHLDAMRAAQNNARKKLSDIQQAQREYYESSKLPPTPQNLQFLNSTEQGKEYQQKILNTLHDINSIEANINDLDAEKTIRIKPLNDLWDHVTNPRTSLNVPYINTLLSNAKALNPEGSIGDIIKTIGEVIKNIITLRCYEVGAICKAQTTKNSLRTTISGLFHRDHTEEKRSLAPPVKPGLSR